MNKVNINWLFDTGRKIINSKSICYKYGKLLLLSTVFSTVTFSNETTSYVPIAIDDIVITIPIKNTIVGTWKTTCTNIDFYGVSVNEVLTLNKDNTYLWQVGEYNSADCTGENINSDEDTSGRYSLGNMTFGQDSNDTQNTMLNIEAQEIDFTFEGGTHYKMFRISGNTLQFSDGYKNTNSGLTPTERQNNFYGANIFYRQ